MSRSYHVTFKQFADLSKKEAIEMIQDQDSLINQWLEKSYVRAQHRKNKEMVTNLKKFRRKNANPL